MEMKIDIRCIAMRERTTSETCRMDERNARDRDDWRFKVQTNCIAVPVLFEYTNIFRATDIWK